MKQRQFRRTRVGHGDDQEDGKQAAAEHAAPAKPPSAPSTSQPAAPAAAARSGGSSSSGRPSTSKPGALLSFGDPDDDGGPMAMAAKPRKEARERKPKIPRPQGLPDLPVAAASTQRSAAGEYSTERLRELQGNALSYSAAKFASVGGDQQEEQPAAAPAAAAAGTEPIIKLSGSFKALSARAKDDRYEMGSAIALVQQPSSRTTPSPEPPSRTARQGQAEEGAVPGAGLGRPQQQGQQQPAGPAAAAEAAQKDEEEDEDGAFIPDKETIRLAKMKRERLRQAHLAPDYIPMHAITRGAGAGARLGVRGPAAAAAAEGEGGEAAASGSDSGEEPEEAMRLRFGAGVGPSAAEQRRQRRGKGARGAGAAAGAGGGKEEEEDEEETFAQAQLNKAIRRSAAAMPSPSPQEASTASTAAAGHYTYDYNPAAAVAAAAATLSWGGGLGGLGSGAPGGLSVQAQIGAAAASALSSLRQGLDRLRASHQATQSNLKRSEGNLASALQRIEGLEGDTKKAGERYVYMQKIRAYIADLCDCLAHKSLVVEELEEDLATLREDRAAATREASAALEREMLQPAEAAAAAALAALAKGAGAAAATAAASGAAAAVEQILMDGEDGNGEMEVDEFGRSVEMERDRERERRASIRAALLEQELARAEDLYTRGDLSVLLAEDGGEGEAEAEVRRYAARHREILDTAATVFLDAGDEFAGIRPVKAALEEFKLSHPKEYNQTYMHLSTPALFAPYVRLELLRWDPLFTDGPTASTAPTATSTDAPAAAAAAPVHKRFDALEWYEALFDFSVPPESGDASGAPPDDPDADLVPALVRQLILPSTLHMLRRCWAPSHLGQSRAAAALLGELFVYVPSDEPWEELSDVVKVVLESLEKAVAATAVPPWPPGVTFAARAAAALQFRRFRQAVRLMHCLSCFEGVVSRPLLLQMSVARLAVAQCLPYLRAALATTAGVDAYQLAVVRLEAVVTALPAKWFEGGTPSEAGPLVDHVAALARSLEGQRSDRARAPLAARLARVAAHLGDKERAGRLASAFGFSL